MLSLKMLGTYKTKNDMSLGCRRILYVMVVSGFILNAVLKTILNITIIAMIRKENDTSTEDLFDWTEAEKQDILGVFFWGFAFTKVPSGRLAEMVGSRKVTGFSMVLSSALTILTPLMAFWNYYLLLASRVMFGFVIGASWPAIMPLASKWIPPKEHSVFIAALASTGLGVAISFHLCGVLIAAWGWRSPFYVLGTVSLVWSCLWFYLIYDSPQKHPRISYMERMSLEKQINFKLQKKKIKFQDVPWKAIVLSGPVWAVLVGQVSTFFAFATLCNELPSYMDQVLHLNIEQTGAFSGMPYWALISGYIADALRKSEKMSVTAIRKLFETVGLTLPTLCMLTLALYGNITPVALTAFTISLTTNAITSAGHCANMLDLTTNFSGTICGIVNTISAFVVFFSTKLVASLLENGHGFNEWRNLFWVLLGTYVGATIIYLVLCSGELQPWDIQKPKRKSLSVTEIIPLGKQIA